MLGLFVFSFLVSLYFIRQAQRLVVGHSAITPSQAILYVMKEAGIAAKYHLDLVPTFISGSRAAMALVAGDISFLVTGAP